MLRIHACSKCGESRPPFSTLPCCHILCDTCVQYGNLTDTADLKSKENHDVTATKTCPVCQHATKPFPQNEELFGKLQNTVSAVRERFVDSHPGSRPECCICNIRNMSSPASHQCLDCGDKLCEACQSGHRSSSATHSHDVVEIKDIMDVKYKLKVRSSVFCMEDKHAGKKYDYFCEECNLPLCTLCLVLGHMGHSVTSIDDASAKHRGQLAELNSQIENDLKDQLTSVKDKLDHQKATVEKTHAATISAVKQRTQALVDEIRRQEKIFLQELTDHQKHQFKELDGRASGVQERLQLGAMSVALTKLVLDEGSSEDCVSLYPDLSAILQMSSGKSIKRNVVKALKTPVCTIEYCFPELESLYSFQDNSPQSSVGATPVHNSNSLGTNSTEVDSHEKEDDTVIFKTNVNLTNRDFEIERTKGSNEFQKTHLMNLKVTDDSVKEIGFSQVTADISNTTETSKSHQDENDDQDCNEDEVFKVTESLSIVGVFGRHLSTTERNVSGTNENDTLPDIIPGPIDCTVKTDYIFPGQASDNNDISDTVRAEFAHIEEGVPSVMLSPKSLSFVMKPPTSIRKPKDLYDPIIVGLCGNDTCGKNDTYRIIVLDNGNRKVRFLDGLSGNQYNIIPLNDNNEVFSYFGIAKAGNHTAYAGTNTIRIYGDQKKSQTRIQLGITRDAANARLPLCFFDSSSFLVANLPGNKQRVYDTSGNLKKESICPVANPITAISRTGDGNYLYSTLCKNGAVYLVNSNNEVLRSYRPIVTSPWYPEGTCVDISSNVYVAAPRENRIYVFADMGPQIYVHDVIGMTSPRCLLMIPYNTLLVTADSPRLHKYKCVLEN